MFVFFLSLLSFFLGSLPFSLWLSRWLAGADVRSVGDGNPGATNALKAGGWKVGLAALMLDISKAAFPVGLAYQIFDLRGWPVFFISISPVLGHAYSPFLRFHGGKGLAAMLGVWIGLTLYEIPLILLFFITFWFLVQTLSGWASLLTILCAIVYLFVFRSDPLFLSVAFFQAVFVVLKHRSDLRQRPQLRPWLRTLFRK